ncbi:hypothetical protein TNCV_4995921 [Trichonephila clavipes]|nr:hypothetical protein TNCV_4995921 [Trichonephila clavipes]
MNNQSVRRHLDALRSNHWEVEEGRSVTSVAAVRLQHRFTTLQFQTTGTAIRSVVVVHEEPHPQMTGTLSYRPEETGGRQREKSLFRPISRFTVAMHGGSVCTTPCTVYCPSEKAFSVCEYYFTDESIFFFIAYFLERAEFLVH